MISLAFAYLLILLEVASPIPDERLTVHINATECAQDYDVLICDYGNRSQATVDFSEITNSFLKSVILYNIEELFLNTTSFENITLINVKTITVLPTYAEEEKGLTHLTVKKSSLPRLPESVTFIYLDQCRIELLSSSPFLKSLTIIDSIVHRVNLTHTQNSVKSITFQNTSVSSLQCLAIGPQGAVLFEDSVVDNLANGGVLVDNGTLTLLNSFVNVASNNSILLMRSSSVQLVKFHGDLNIRAVDSNNSANESQESKCEPDKTYFIAYIAFLILFIIMTALFLFTMGIKRNKDSQKEEKSQKSDREKEKKVYTVSEDKNRPTTQPLLADTADEAPDNSIDTFEDDIMKSLDITKALHIEDLEDIKCDMNTALDARNKTAFEEFMNENSKRLQLQQFQIKSMSKLDKNTVMLQRMNQAVRDLIEEQYLNSTFDITNTGDDIKLSHKEKIVECNKRFLDDLREILKTAVDKWDQNLKEDQKHCSHLVQYIRNVLSLLHKSMNQLQLTMERNMIKSNDKRKGNIAKLEQTHATYLKSIKLSAENKLELVRSIEKEDAEIFGSKKAFQLSSIQEDTVNISEILQQKHAARECSEVRQNLLHQEEIIKFQEDHMSHLERIATMLTDLRRCYFQFPKNHTESNASRTKDEPRLFRLSGHPGTDFGNTRSSEDLNLTIFREGVDE